MPVTIKTGSIKYKDSNGQYVGIGAVGNGNIEEAVDNWLNENITNPDSPPLDRSLSQPEAAAPADIVGNVKNDLDDINHIWGTYEESVSPTITNNSAYKATDGSVMSYNYFSRTDLINVSSWQKAYISANAFGDAAGVCFFDKDEEFISSIWNDGTHTLEEVTFPAGCLYIGVSSHNGTSIAIKAVKYITIADVLNSIRAATASDVGKILTAKTITDNEVVEWEFIDPPPATDNTLSIAGDSADAKATGDAIKTITHAWGTVTENATPSITTGEGYKKSDGSVGTYVAERRTPLIDISNWTGAKVSCKALGDYAGVCFYDKNQTFISATLTDGEAYSEEPVTFPTNAMYMGVSSHSSVDIKIIATRYVTIAEVAAIIDALKAKTLDGYFNKNIVLFGDSITDINANGKWVTAIQQIMQFKNLKNYARGYCTWSFYSDTQYDVSSTGNTRTSDNVIWNQYNRLCVDVANESTPIPDAIIIMAGTNDVIYGSTQGTVAEALAIQNIRTTPVGQLNNVCASIRRVLEDVVATFPQTKIFICTPIQCTSQHSSMQTLVQLILDMCANYSIDVPNLNRDCGISYYIEKNADVYLNPDGTHPNDNGGKLIANFMKSWLYAHYGADETITKTYIAPET